MHQDSLGNTTENEKQSTQRGDTSINALPLEIFILIFAHVSPVDLKDLRLVCRKWNDVILDNGTWIRAFDNRLGTGKIFASTTRSNIWIQEYFGRMAAIRRWAKAKAFSRLYQLVNNLFGRITQVETDFVNDRLLTFSQFSGTISLCSLTLGKNQVFIPESSLFGEIVAFDVTWNYSCVANTNGGLFLKNLITATASGSNQSSVKKIAQSEFPFAAVKLNKFLDKNREKPDVVSLTQDGALSFWSISGKLVANLNLHGTTLDLRTDFKTVVVISQDFLHVIDLVQATVVTSFQHGWRFNSLPIAFEVDFHDHNVVVADKTLFKVFHYNKKHCKILEESAPEGLSIIEGTMQDAGFPRNQDIAGGDGLLFALTFSDGSVGVVNIRDLDGTIPFKTRILPFRDDRAPQGIESYTKVALNSTVIAIGALADWIHFYDAHSGKYLREGTKISRKFTRQGTMPILKIQFSPNGFSGVVVSDDAIQYFRYGEDLIVKKKPFAPQAVDLKSRRTVNQHIKSEMADYNEQVNQKLQEDILLDKYNGVKFDDEQDELRVALALSISCGQNGQDVLNDKDDSDLAAALALLEEASKMNSFTLDEDLELRAALRLSESESYRSVHGLETSQSEGLSNSLHMDRQLESLQNDSEDEVLRKIIELSMLEQ
ncbi:hypothetical protein METBIDRAFT_32968 [Metschnikowia bicuspidata var. bicuspidata NRRL YB-4993]|uniref:F-box domain-containing protein n=1 Tax=Metschnikowia bicuspidata var. bicuspidata NRRL YB-4993 TaxID=869754 RepID=A0A1A0H7F3_9ASCO|nr:hypothetical protein METBIDRAFT_32968 [Metschnikowia bicuspidata var. bicuspidata NRRL YB-4993]OBA19956.1 hypothetical protein METBIDRAFT_32968 [Metschnikowia bicuspidata var. bicuspidata NRRL YB-4993]